MSEQAVRDREIYERHLRNHSRVFKKEFVRLELPSLEDQTSFPVHEEDRGYVEGESFEKDYNVFLKKITATLKDTCDRGMPLAEDILSNGNELGDTEQFLFHSLLKNHVCSSSITITKIRRIEPPNESFQPDHRDDYFRSWLCMKDILYHQIKEYVPELNIQSHSEVNPDFFTPKMEYAELAYNEGDDLEYKKGMGYRLVTNIVIVGSVGAYASSRSFQSIMDWFDKNDVINKYKEEVEVDKVTAVQLAEVFFDESKKDQSQQDNTPPSDESNVRCVTYLTAEEFEEEEEEDDALELEEKIAQERRIPDYCEAFESRFKYDLKKYVEYLHFLPVH